MNNSNSPRKSTHILNTPINITAIINFIFCNVRNFLGIKSPKDELDINQPLIPDEDLGLPANGMFSPKFSQLLRDVLDKKL